MKGCKSVKINTEFIIYLNCISEYVQVEKISGAVFRHKRAAAIIFPNNMIFRFQIEAGEVTLNLERTSNNHQAAKAPIYTIEESGIVFRNHTTKVRITLVITMA